MITKLAGRTGLSIYTLEAGTIRMRAIATRSMKHYLLHGMLVLRRTLLDGCFGMLDNLSFNKDKKWEEKTKRKVK